MINPLLNSFILPPFSSICPEHVVPAVRAAIQNCYKTIDKVVAQTCPCPCTWENLCQPLAEADDWLSRIWSSVSHLHAVKNSPSLRKAYKTSLQLLSEYSTYVGQHRGIYKAYLNLRNHQHYTKLSVAQKKTVDNMLRDFQLSGIGLPATHQQRYKQIVTSLSELSANYSNNVLDATMGWNKLIIQEPLLTGMPDHALAGARAQAQACEQEGWLLTLDLPSYLSVLTYCDNAALREEIYWAYTTRASDQGPNAGTWDNGPIINEMLALRHELARLLGFNSYAEKSLATKMAQDPRQVLAFLTELTKLARPQGQQELDQLRAFAQRHFDHEQLNPWDLLYYSEKQKQYLFSINDEQLRLYFPESRVLNGLFEVVNRMYDITTKECKNVDTWHPDVRFFHLFNKYGEQRGCFYLDLYARNNKLDGAWMDDGVGMMRQGDGKLQKPVAYITCNFNRPVNDKPALLSHNEVTTLFHEFGHGLHHILTSIYTSSVAGIRGVPWDAVELPSQFMENYCWQREALQFISGHYETGEPLPDNVLNQLIKAKNYQSALFILRQLELGMFDFQIHYQYDPDHSAGFHATMEKVNKQVTVVPTVPWERVPNTFSHIFSGDDYAAGYYSYLWSNVLAADAWSRFEEEGIFNRKTSESFLDHIISRGGSEEPMVLFTRFRGRAPQLDAMLRHYGIQKIE